MFRNSPERKGKQNYKKEKQGFICIGETKTAFCPLDAVTESYEKSGERRRKNPRIRRQIGQTSTGPGSDHGVKQKRIVPR